MQTIIERLEGIWQSILEAFHVPDISQYVAALTETVEDMLPPGAMAAIGILLAASVALFILNRRT